VILNADQDGVDYAMKHRIVHALQKYLLNPPIKLALALALPLPGYGCSKRKDGRRGSHGARQWAMDASVISSG
jgi:hypothetical protein